MPRTSPETLRGAIFSAETATMQRPATACDDGDSAARPVEHHKTSSAEQPADNFGEVVLNSLLADREWQ